ncbi:NAD(P)-dependent oxidoreductase [Alcaligenaceae bacterium LF4-65]|uniref:NAD(P)-dependent oxidoreductase n=1 Tax=Zwartia hollandica TaxID=324606 RepID=A0A953NBG4_9BURK|nr:NAD(P)-dependent oxidoreductase [Zwartia hollandica]MBZ1350220.1 NAD(P)-dependent oxidoreductase [Zwartia hollandica]
MSAKPTIGFVGVGSMGWPMAALLQKAGYPLQIVDASAERAKAFAKEIGGTVAASNRALATASDIIITILPTSAIVQAVLEGPEGVLAGLRKNAVVVEMSSGVPTITRTLAEQVAAAGAHMVDAPVSGGVPRAKTGELAIMFGGSEAILERIRPVLSCMGTSITRTGDVGSAHAMKALNNLVSAGGFLIGVEALMIGKRFGLDPSAMVDVLNSSTGMNNSTQKKFKQFVLSGQYNAGFGLDLMVKDLSIALGIGRDTNTPTPFSAMCREMWASCAAMLGPGQDHTAIAKLTETLAGDTLSEKK